MENLTDDLGIVVIGRNEGERLKQCLQSVLSQIGRTDSIVYVDSGSSDGSVEYAESIGVEVVRLDMLIPFSAGRARNEGFQLLNEKNNKLKYIQFIDGDCKICEGWLSYAYTYLENNKSCAVVAGRRKERFPEHSIYNMLCDIEWNTPIGDAKACGGDFMIRKEAFQQVNGFNPIVISGEEPEMCYRLRKNNWSIFRLDHPMTLHDAAITRFSQWWKRCLRTGHGYAHGFSLYVHDGQGYCFKELVSMWFWAFIFPVSVLILSFSIDIFFLLLMTAYIVQLIKIALNMNRRLRNAMHSLSYGFFIVLGKWPQFMGQLVFLKRKFFGKKYSIIEYN